MESVVPDHLARVLRVRCGSGVERIRYVGLVVDVRSIRRSGDWVAVRVHSGRGVSLVGSGNGLGAASWTASAGRSPAP